jgi:protein SCO1/2
MNKKLLGYAFFFLALVLVVYYVVITTDQTAKNKIPVISQVNKFSFTNQDGNIVTEKDIQGKVVVVEYFFTTCKGICPRMNKNMQSIYNEFKDEPDFLILAHTCQPEIDSVARLKFYADSLQINTKKWVLLTGRKDSLYNMARSSYLIDDAQNIVNNIDDDFMHTQFFALVDKNGKVRGSVYDGLKTQEINQLKINIKLLLKEKMGPNGFANSIFTNNPQ